MRFIASLSLLIGFFALALAEEKVHIGNGYYNTQCQGTQPFTIYKIDGKIPPIRRTDVKSVKMFDGAYKLWHNVDCAGQAEAEVNKDTCGYLNGNSIGCVLHA
ncbi:unnamed protein product [Sympodiomycopsis kandeliae]